MKKERGGEGILTKKFLFIRKSTCSNLENEGIHTHLNLSVHISDVGLEFFDRKKFPLFPHHWAYSCKNLLNGKYQKVSCKDEIYSFF